MDIQEILNNKVAAMRAEELKTSPILTVGELIARLEACGEKDGEDDKTVAFDFEYAHPTTLSSWRGIYAELAFQFEFDGKEKTVAEILAELRGAIGKTYEGYKGGDFVMGKGTPVWVANYGNSGETGIVGVLDLGYKVILETKYLNRQ